MTPSQPSHPDRNGPGRLCVLIVEDNADAAQSTRMLIEMDRHDVHVARDGIAALEVAAAVEPDVILLDIGLPGLSGYEVAERLRGRKARKRLLLVAVTGYATEADRERSAAAGIDLHLSKPVEPGLLLGLLRRFANHMNPAPDE
jgi:two-component system CheB/CheR fusion protein